MAVCSVCPVLGNVWGTAVWTCYNPEYWLVQFLIPDSADSIQADCCAGWPSEHQIMIVKCILQWVCVCVCGGVSVDTDRDHVTAVMLMSADVVLCVTSGTQSGAVCTCYNSRMLVHSVQSSLQSRYPGSTECTAMYRTMYGVWYRYC